ncbi:MAG TPA: TetR/AcrR family transcriptional regulator [Chitinophagaceae bacterium]|nr:TetR/AcrR family transcriptional regulator [Chitinophagaceae bacterium]
MLTTKQRILKISEKLFFEQGIANVRLQQIADNSGISIGNLAYHFNNKEVIVEEVYNALLRDLSALHSGKINYEGLKSFDDYFSLMYSFQKENGFYLNNFWEIERTYPKIKKVWQKLNNKMLQQLSKRIIENVKCGNIKEKDFAEAYDLLANALLLTLNYRIPQQILRSKPVKEIFFKKSLWNLLYPYFTARGKKEYNKLNIR